MTKTVKEVNRLLILVNKWRGLARKYKEEKILASKQAAYHAKKVTILEREKEKGFLQKLLDRFLKY